MNPAVRHETVGAIDAPDRLRIAHLSDFHLWFSDRLLRDVEERLAVWRPDVLALTGDYADTPWGRRIARRWIERMAAVYPLCWVAGNHDRWGGRSFVRGLAALGRAHAIDVRDAWLRAPKGGLFRFTSWERLAAGAVDGPAIVLLHDPAIIEPQRLRGRREHVLLAGHLHGGQINLWRDRAGRPQPAGAYYRWLADRSMIETVPLIVSRGLGDTLPVRIGAPKEMVIVDFWAGTADLTRTSAPSARRDSLRAVPGSGWRAA